MCVILQNIYIHIYVYVCVQVCKVSRICIELLVVVHPECEVGRD